MAVNLICGGSFSKDKTRVRRITQKFEVTGPAQHEGDEPWDELDNFMPAKTPLGLPEVGRQASKEENGSWILEITFEGAPDNATFEDEVELDHAGAEDPIETFEKFEALALKWHADFDQQTQQFKGWKRRIKDKGSGKTIKNPLYGFSHYLNDSVILRVTFNVRDFDPAWLRNICKIDEPRLTNPRTARMKDVPEGRNWLKKVVKVKFKGNIFQYTVEWLLSGPGGWVPDVYNPN